MGGYNMSFSAGVRVDIGDPGLGAFAGVAFRAVAEEFDLTSRRESGPGLEAVGGAWYQPMYEGDDVTYVVVEAPAGSENAAPSEPPPEP